MKRTLLLIVVAGLAVYTAASAQVIKTIRGEVIDVSCYVIEGARGDEHKSCALACLRAGEPAGILEEGTGKIYIIITEDHTNPAKKVLPYVAKVVEVTGTINERGGINTIDIQDINESGAVSMGMPGAGMGMQKEGMEMMKGKKGMMGH